MATSLKTWLNNNPPQVEDDDYNGFKLEPNNAILASGQTLSDTDREQLAKTHAITGSRGDFYQEAAGSASDVYVLENVGSQKQVFELKDGMRIRFRVVNANTGASTCNVNGLGAKNIFKSGGILVSGDLVSGNITTLVFNEAQDRFDVLVSEGGSADTAAALGIQSLFNFIYAIREGLAASLVVSNAAFFAMLDWERPINCDLIGVYSNSADNKTMAIRHGNEDQLSTIDVIDAVGSITAGIEVGASGTPSAPTLVTGQTYGTGCVSVTFTNLDGIGGTLYGYINIPTSAFSSKNLKTGIALELDTYTNVSSVAIELSDGTNSYTQSFAQGTATATNWRYDVNFDSFNVPANDPINLEAITSVRAKVSTSSTQTVTMKIDILQTFSPFGLLPKPDSSTDISENFVIREDGTTSKERFIITDDNGDGTYEVSAVTGVSAAALANNYPGSGLASDLDDVFITQRDGLYELNSLNIRVGETDLTACLSLQSSENKFINSILQGVEVNTSVHDVYSLSIGATSTIKIRPKADISADFPTGQTCILQKKSNGKIIQNIEFDLSIAGSYALNELTLTTTDTVVAAITDLTDWKLTRKDVNLTYVTDNTFQEQNASFNNLIIGDNDPELFFDDFSTDKGYTTVLDTSISWSVTSGYGEFDWSGAFNGLFQPVYAYQTLASALPTSQIVISFDMLYYNDGFSVTVCGAGGGIGATPVLNQRQGIWLGMTGQDNGAHAIDVYYNNAFLGQVLNAPSINTWYRGEIKIIASDNIEFRAWDRDFGTRPTTAQFNYTGGISYSNPNIIFLTGRAGNNGANTSGGSRVDNFSISMEGNMFNQKYMFEAINLSATNIKTYATLNRATTGSPDKSLISTGLITTEV